jgi:hypothetical protein
VSRDTLFLGDKMFVTTAGRTNEIMVGSAKEIAKELNIPFINRKKQSIETLQKILKSDCIVVGKERIELYVKNSKHPFFFHPNSASFRIKRLLKGQHDPFVTAAKLEQGMSILDCTTGLASDSIVAAFIVGEKGKVYSIEGNKYLSYLVNKGLHSWESDLQEMNEAMRRINVYHLNYEEFLLSCPDKMVDVIYFDPMFEESILASDGIQTLKELAIYGGLKEEVIQEAKRVAKSRIVLKNHFRSNLFHDFNFQVFKRQSAKFHFGIIDL